MTVSKFKLMAGLNNPYESWIQPSRSTIDSVNLTESSDSSREQLLSEFTRGKVAIKRLARLLEDNRYGGTHLPEFNSVYLEKMMEAVAAGGIGASAAKHHIKAVQASKVAHSDHHASAEVAHSAHKNASQLHRNAAMHLSQAGDTATAAAHEKWASHHDKVASHIAKASTHSHAPAEAPARAKLPATHKASVEAPAQKQRKDSGPSHLPGELPDAKHPAMRPGAKRVLSVHKDPFAGSMSDKGKADHHAVSGKAHSDDHHSRTAQNLSFATSALSKDKTVSHKELAGTHEKAARGHLKAAIHHFMKGDHTTALTHFNAAIGHKKSGSGHAEAGASAKRVPAAGGARAAVGMTHRPG